MEPPLAGPDQPRLPDGTSLRRACGGFASGSPKSLTPIHFREAPPALKAMTALPPCTRLPIKVAAIGFKTSGRGTAVEVPLESGEQLYGLGMNLKVFQLHGKKTVRVSDDQSTTLGDSHAPVPFYVSTAAMAFM